MLEGTVRFDAGDDSFVLTAGQSTTIPLGTPHTFSNASADERARLLGTVSPARYIKYFRELSCASDEPRGSSRPRVHRRSDG